MLHGGSVSALGPKIYPDRYLQYCIKDGLGAVTISQHTGLFLCPVGCEAVKYLSPVPWHRYHQGNGSLSALITTVEITRTPYLSSLTPTASRMTRMLSS